MHLPFADALVCLTFAASAAAFAATEQVDQGCAAGPCFDSLPVLTPPRDWQIDRERSLLYGITVLTPQGPIPDLFGTVIYAQALPKSRFSKIRTLEAFIRQTQSSQRRDRTLLSIQTASPLYTADGKLIRTWRLLPKGSGRWERAGYFEEGDFYMAFTIGAKTAAELSKNEHSFETLIREYRE